MKIKNINLLKNKRGDIESIFFVVIFLAVIGFVLFLMSHLNQEIFGELSQNLEKNSTANYTKSVEVVEDFKSRDAVIWDYAFLGIFMGSLIALGLTAYAIRISPVFYWIYGVMSLLVLGTGVILSNIWQEMAVEPEFASTLSNFPIMNLLLGNFYPLAVTGIIIIAMVIIFGKPAGREEGYI